MDEIQKNLDLVNQYQKEIFLFEKIGALLSWDEETHMPKKGIGTRAEKIAYLAKLMHEKITSEELFKAVQFLKGKLMGDNAIMIERLEYDLIKSRKMTPELVEELSKTVTVASNRWREAKEKKDFSIFEPYLTKIIELKRKEAKLKGYKDHPYNALLDDFERGMTEEKLNKEFEVLKKGVIDLLNRIKGSKKYKEQKIILLKNKFDKEKQIELAQGVTKRMGLSSETSRIDFAEHPFMTTIGIDDVRITTNIRDDPLFSFHSSIHEAGHALYEMYKPREHFYNVLYQEPSLGIHESQSRFWENCIGKGQRFWRFYFNKFNDKFGLNGTMKEWFDEVNFIEPSMIRIESDEVHYILHIILRFELEMGLIDGSIVVKDLPGIWKEKMKSYFGIEPANVSEGVLQDVHWSHGSIGYFPTYALGSVYAAQLYHQMIKEHPKYEDEIEKGDFENIRAWLTEKIHKHGKKMLAEELIKSACGEGLNVKVFLDYLDKKYSKIYAI